ncbi:MAG TPA: Ig-like domain-containing protein, partial [Verrucomicrobiae bacterium]|nr:Ig-like domain-containing protein [Verrucomicrobiae bacterium]
MSRCFRLLCVRVLVLWCVCAWFAPEQVRAAILFDQGSVWRWRPGTNEASTPLEAWRLLGFNDVEFTTAPAPFWYGDVLLGGTQISGMQGVYSCVFLRKTFTIANPNELTALRLGALVDDGFVAWINGVEVQRVNMLEPAGSPVNVSTLAANAIEPVPFLSYTLTNISSYLVAGANELAVQVFQSSLSSSDLGFDCALESILVDVDSPRLIGVQPAPGSTLSNLLQVTVTFDEPVDGVDAGDLLINGGPANAVSALNERTFLFSFSQPAYGGVQFSWRATHGIQDQAVPPNAFDAADPSALWSYTLIDRTPPAVAGIDPASGAVVRSLNSINILFNEPVSGVNAGDLLINQTPATGLTTLAPDQYLFTFPAPPTGLVTVAWAPAANIIDAAGNALAGGNWTYQFDPNAGGDLPYISELMASNTRTL